MILSSYQNKLSYTHVLGRRLTTSPRRSPTEQRMDGYHVTFWPPPTGSARKSVPRRAARRQQTDTTDNRYQETGDGSFGRHPSQALD